MSYVLAGGSLIIIALSFVAIYYSYLWHQRKKVIDSYNEEQKMLIDEKQREATLGIVLLARALEQGQVSATEASMRISHLARSLDLSPEQSDLVQVFDKLAQASSHIPILDAWKRLSRQEQWQYEKDRLRLEAQYEDFIEASAKTIAQGEAFVLPTPQ